MLDVGTGTGALIPFLKSESNQNVTVWAIDVSQGMLDIAAQRYPECKFWHGDIIDFPVMSYFLYYLVLAS